MKRLIRKAVVGSPFEGVARRAFLRFGPTQNARYDRRTIAVMKRALSKDSNCVDIGCCRGIILREALRLAPNGQHYAFEPIPYLYRRLVASHPGVSLYNLALSDVAQQTQFEHVVGNPDHSSLKPRRHDPGERVEYISVSTDLLDNVVPPDVPVRFIKVDVEGAELQVLRGAVGTIRRNKPVIVFEHGLGGSSYFGTTPEDVYDLLVRDCGMRVSLMERWLKNESPVDREQFGDQVRQKQSLYFIAY